MTDVSQEKASRERSPSFPFISLKTAIERLTEFEQKFGRQEPTADRAYLAWGMKGDTSQAGQTLAALKSFGLLYYKGTGPKRLVAISDSARGYLRAKQESVRRDALKRAALTPKWIAYFWSQWGSDPVPDEIRQDTLVLTHKFNENAAPNFLKVYDDTIAFAGLSDSDKIQGETGSVEEEEVDPILDLARKITPSKLGQQHAGFPLPEGTLTLSFPAKMSVDSAKTMRSFLELLVKQVEQLASIREQNKGNDEASD